MFERIGPNDLPRFLRQYRLAGGKIHRVRLLYPGPKKVAIEFYLSIRETIKSLGTDPRKVRLILRLEGVEEYRFQMRPGQAKVKIADARIGYLNGLFFANFDAWGLEPGEMPKLHDYRASELYAGGSDLLVREVKQEKPASEE